MSRSYKKYYLICILCMFCWFSAKPQNSPEVNGDYSGFSIKDFLNSLQKQTGYSFYYDTTGIDTVKLTVGTVNREPLKHLLQQVFDSSPYSFTIYRDMVFIYRGQPINAALNPLFFETQPTDSSRQRYIITSVEAATEGNGNTVENKLYEIGNKTTLLNGDAKLAGYVRDNTTGEPVSGVVLFDEKLKISVTTDQYGYYSITLPKGRHRLDIQALGKRDTHREIALYDDGNLNIDMKDHVLSLKAVVISAKKAANINSMQMGLEKVDIRTIKQIPVVFGEADVLRIIQMLPGVKTVGEAATGFNVRGGSTDQNLILFNDATIYNPSHFFGFFSAFNPELISGVELYKSSIPARYGGRLSSVLDISGREGNKKKFAGSAGIGLLTSRLNLEGPIKKDKTSIIAGGRLTYANWLLQHLPKEYQNSRASFYDANIMISHNINEKNDLYLTGYISSDRFNLNSDTAYGYGNKNLVLKWKHLFNNKLNMVITGGYDDYGYNIQSEKNPYTAYKMKFGIEQFHFKTNFNYFINAKHTIEFGVASQYYFLHPGSLQPRDTASRITPQIIQREQAVESAVFASEKFNITPGLSLQAGIRLSTFQYLGPKTYYDYAPGLPKSSANIVDTISKNGGVIKNYGGPEYRLALLYVISENLSVKAGYNSLRQYIHMISNTTAMAPTDIWKLSDANIRPQQGDQFAVGVYKNFRSNTIETSVEAYYKRIKDFLDYKSGAVLVLNNHVETDVFNTKGKAYGIELMIKKMTGKLNGWFSYTWSRTLLKMDDPNSGEVINNGNYYPANYDKPHDATLAINYRFTHRYSVSLNSTYSTGRPVTIPIGRYVYDNGMRALYSDRNAYRIPDYFRVDFSVNLEGNHKLKQKTHNFWTFGVYNMLGRKNPYSVYFVTENGVINGYKLSIFGAAIFYANFNIRF